MGQGSEPWNQSNEQTKTKRNGQQSKAQIQSRVQRAESKSWRKHRDKRRKKRSLKYKENATIWYITKGAHGPECTRRVGIIGLTRVEQITGHGWNTWSPTLETQEWINLNLETRSSKQIENERGEIRNVKTTIQEVTLKQKFQIIAENNNTEQTTIRQS